MDRRYKVNNNFINISLILLINKDILFNKKQRFIIKRVLFKALI
jgi:hypothetical protein